MMNELDCEIRCRRCGNIRRYTYIFRKGQVFKNASEFKGYYRNNSMEFNCESLVCNKTTIHDFVAFDSSPWNPDKKDKT